MKQATTIQRGIPLNLVYPLADALHKCTLVLNKEAKVITGGVIKKVTAFDSLDVEFELKVVDTFIDEGNDKAMVMVHCGGALYLLILNDDRVRYMTIFVLDALKMPTGKKVSTLLTDLKKVSPGWSRNRLMGAIVDVMVAQFGKATEDQEAPWKLVRSDNKDLKKYLELRKLGGKADSARDLLQMG